MVTEEKIAKKFQCNAELVEKYIKEGTFGKDAEITVGNDPTGVPSIVVNVGKAEVEGWLIKQLRTVLTELFRDESGEPGLVFQNYSVEYASGCPTKIYLNYSDNKDVEYDYSDAKEYLEHTCPPSVISAYCSDALNRLWNIHKAMGVECATVFEDFDEVAATIQICKKIADKIIVKEG